MHKKPLKIRTLSSGIDRSNLGWKMLPEEQRNKSEVQNTFPVSSTEERRAGRSCGVRVRERQRQRRDLLLSDGPSEWKCAEEDRRQQEEEEKCCGY